MADEDLKDVDGIVKYIEVWFKGHLAKMLNIKNYIATNYNVKTGKIYGKNCYGEAKVEEFERIYPKAKLEAFYSDSLSDLPMMKLAEKAYLVDGENVKEIDTKDYEEQ